MTVRDAVPVQGFWKLRHPANTVRAHRAVNNEIDFSVSLFCRRLTNHGASCCCSQGSTCQCPEKEESGTACRYQDLAPCWEAHPSQGEKGRVPVAEAWPPVLWSPPPAVRLLWLSLLHAARRRLLAQPNQLACFRRYDLGLRGRLNLLSLDLVLGLDMTSLPESGSGKWYFIKTVILAIWLPSSGGLMNLGMQLLAV